MQSVVVSRVGPNWKKWLKSAGHRVAGEIHNYSVNSIDSSNIFILGPTLHLSVRPL